jgi:polar amino acid transport system substrate-binding protein
MASVPFTLVTEEYAPYSWTPPDGQVRGIAVDIVTALMVKANVSACAPVVLPWARAVAQTERAANTCLFSAARTAAREKRFKWISPIGRLEWVLFARAQDKLMLANLDQAKALTIGTYIGNGTVDMLRAHGLKVDLTPSDRVNPRTLQLRRIDQWAVGKMPGLHLLRQLRIEGIEPVFNLAETDLYLACNLALPDDQVSYLNGIVQQMYSNGTIRGLYEQYGYAASFLQ